MSKYDVRSNNYGGEKSKSLYKNGERQGFVQKRETDDGRTRYGLGIDNVGSPYKGVMDRTISTPLGELDYGYDGDTVGVGFTPAQLQNMSYSYPNGSYNSYYIDNIAGMYPGVYSHPHNGEQRYGAEIEGFPVTGNGWQDYNTPFGKVRGGLSDDAVLGAEITPNEKTQYYINALANLLRR